MEKLTIYLIPQGLLHPRVIVLDNDVTGWNQGSWSSFGSGPQITTFPWKHRGGGGRFWLADIAPKGWGFMWLLWKRGGSPTRWGLGDVSKLQLLLQWTEHKQISQEYIHKIFLIKRLLLKVFVLLRLTLTCCVLLSLSALKPPAELNRLE